MYADDLWWDIFNLSENKKCPTSLRGIGAFSIHAAQLKEYAFLDECAEETNEEELSEKWQNIFCLAFPTKTVIMMQTNFCILSPYCTMDGRTK